MQIGVMFGNPETTPGGKALKFYTSVRIDIRRIAQIKKGDEVMGGRHRVKIVKNKVAAPFRQTEFDMLYSEGISKEGEALALGEKLGLVQKSSGGAYSHGRNENGPRLRCRAHVSRENKPVLNQLLKDIRKGLQDGGGVVGKLGRRRGVEKIERRSIGVLLCPRPHGGADRLRFIRLISYALVRKYATVIGANGKGPPDGECRKR